MIDLNLIAELVVRMATEKATWGYTRIQGALAELGINVGRSTIQRVLAEPGIDPAPQRGGLSWKEFLAAHWGAIAAADFFTVEILRPWGLARYHVFFAIDLKTRVVDIAGVCADPFGAWMVQVARNLTDCDGFLVGHRQLILDRDPLFTCVDPGRRGGESSSGEPGHESRCHALSSIEFWDITRSSFETIRDRVLGQFGPSCPDLAHSRHDPIYKTTEPSTTGLTTSVESIRVGA